MAKKNNTELIEEKSKCPSCGSKELAEDYSRGEKVCQSCGLVIAEDIIDQGPEWRAFDSEQRDKRSRVGAPENYSIHDKGLSTRISWQNRDAYGNVIPTRNRAQIYRLRKWQRRTRISDGTERNLAVALSNLSRMSSTLNLPRNVRETASMIYRKAVRKKLIRGRSIEGIAAAVLYAACRQCNVPRTLEEMSRVTDLPKKEIGRNYRHLSRELELKLLPTTPQDYVSRFCGRLSLPADVQIKALHLLKQAQQKELTSGRGPTGMSAAAIYIASVVCEERITQREIAEVAGVTEVTIRNRYKELVNKLEIEINV